MLKQNSKAGSLNRLIEIPAPPKMLFDTKAEFEKHIRCIYDNYGTAGRAFIDIFSRQNRIEKAEEIRNRYISLLQDKAATKQVSSAALILTADELASEWIFQDDQKLTVDDVLPFLRSDIEVNTNIRAHQMIMDWITANSGRFGNQDNRWGKFNHHDGKATCDIIYEQLSKYLRKNKLSIESYVKWAKTTKNIYYDKDGHTAVKVRFKGPDGEELRPRCICIYYEESESNEEIKE